MEILDLGRIFPSKLAQKVEVKRKVFEIEQEEWRTNMYQNSKLIIFRQIVESIEPNSWWKLAKEKPVLLGCITIMMKLMFGDHILNENTGRFNDTHENARMCALCHGDHVESLMHFVMVCDKYKFQRQRLFEKVNSVFPTFLALDLEIKRLLVFGGICENLDISVQKKIMELSCMTIGYMYKLRIAEYKRSRNQEEFI